MMNKGEERGYSQFLRKANTFEQQIRSQCNCCECGNKFKQERFLQSPGLHQMNRNGDYPLSLPKFLEAFFKEPWKTKTPSICLFF